MFFKRLTKYCIFCLSALTAYLASAAIEDVILSKAQQFKPLPATAIGMAVIVVVFLPLFSLLDKITEEVVRLILRASKNTLGRKFGLFAFFAISLLVLLNIYMENWFSLGIVDALFRK